MSGIRSSHDQVWITISVQVNPARQRKSESPELGIDITCEDGLTGVVVDTLGTSSEYEDGTLLFPTAIGCTSGEIFVAILVKIAQSRQGKTEAGSNLSTIADVPPAEFVLKIEFHVIIYFHMESTFLIFT